jgi:hypothetical protein
MVCVVQSPAADNVTATGNNCTPILTHIDNSTITIKSLCCGNCADLESQKIKVSYYNLDSFSATKLVQGHLPANLRKILGEYHPVMQNAVYKNYKFLIDTFGVKHPRGTCEAVLTEADSGDQKHIGIFSPQQCNASIPLLSWNPDAGHQGAFLYPDVQLWDVVSNTQDWPSSFSFIYSDNFFSGIREQPGSTKYLQKQGLILATTIWRDVQLGDFDKYAAQLSNFSRAITKTAQRIVDPSDAKDWASPPFPASPELRAINALRHLTKDGLPHHFALISGKTYHYSECGGSPPMQFHYRFDIVIPELFVRFAILENISKSSQEFRELVVSQHNAVGLRELDKSVGDTEKKTLKIARVLKPGESLIIPIAIILRTPGPNELIDSNANPDSGLQTIETNPREDGAGEKTYAFISSLKDSDTIELRPNKSTKDIGYAQAALRSPAVLSKSKKSFKAPELPPDSRELLYGPSFELQELILGNGDSVAIRQFDRNNIMMVGEIESGSCPLLSTYDAHSKEWQVERTVLKTAVGQSKSGLDRVVVTRFPSKIKLEEFEPEVSFIEEVYIDAHLEDGKVIRISPKQHLDIRDKRYLVVGYLNSREIEFDDTQVPPALWYEIVIKGFYIPLQNMKVSFK